MPHTTSEKLADVALGVALTGAALYILKTPALRRMAWGFAVVGLTRTLPAGFARRFAVPGTRADVLILPPPR